jgi:hypothetical protein
MLSGWAGSGKDTVADWFVRERGYVRVAFADPLKEDVAAETGIPVGVFHDPVAKSTPIAGTARTPRDILIDHARRARAVDPDIYARAIVGKIQSEDLERVVVSDWRLLREYKYVRSMLPIAEVVCVRVSRPGVRVLAEPTEHELDDHSMDIHINNDGDIQSLYVSLANTAD